MSLTGIFVVLVDFLSGGCDGEGDDEDDVGECVGSNVGVGIDEGVFASCGDECVGLGEGVSAS